jgi:hypothetical protein
MGNLPLVLISAICSNSGALFGAQCSTQGLAYSSYGMLVSVQRSRYFLLLVHQNSCLSTLDLRGPPSHMPHAQALHPGGSWAYTKIPSTFYVCEGPVWPVESITGLDANMSCSLFRRTACRYRKIQSSPFSENICSSCVRMRKVVLRSLQTHGSQLRSLSFVLPLQRTPLVLLPF